MAHRNLSSFLRALEDQGRPRPDPRARVAAPRDRRDRRPRGQGGRPGTAFRERRGLDPSGRDQRVRLPPADAAGPRDRLVAGVGRAARFLPRSEAAGRDPRQAQGAPEGRGAGERLSEDRPERTVPGGRRDGRRGGSGDAARPDLLAAGRRALHHAAARDHEGSGHRQDERRHVPDAGLRPRDDRHALAEAQGRGRPGARLRARRAPDGSRRRDRLRSGDRLLRRSRRCPRASRSSCSPGSCAARPCRSSRRRPSTCSCRPRPRSCSRGTWTRRSAGAKGRSATTPGSTRSTTTFRSSTSRRSRAARGPST